MAAEPPPATARERAPDEDGLAVVDDIAVVGLAGRYPGAADEEEFWRNLVAGRDSVTEVPADRWDHAAIFDPERGRAGRTYGR